MSISTDDFWLLLEVIRPGKFNQDRVEQLQKIVIPFGKYSGKTLAEVPLRYLDQTVSEMPDAWIVRRVREFVDRVMEHPIFGKEIGQVPAMTLAKLDAKWKADSLSRIGHDVASLSDP